MIMPYNSENEQHTKFNNLTRFDRNVAENILDFSYYGKEAVLVRDIAFFLMLDFQYSLSQVTLFGKRQLIPKIFANHVGRKNYLSLLNKHPDPEQFKEPKFQKMSKKELQDLRDSSQKRGGEPLYDNILDNALYRCMYDSMKFSKPGSTPSGYTTSELKEIRFLKSLTKCYHPTTGQIYYEYELDDTFINDLARRFLKFDWEVFKKLKVASFQNFYISLIAIRDKFHLSANQGSALSEASVKVELNFDKLCELAQTNCKDASERKKHINKAIKEINSLHHPERKMIELQWVTNGVFKFKPVLNFNYTQQEIQEQTIEHGQRFRLHALKNLRHVYQKTILTHNDYAKFVLEYTNWLINVSNDWKIKHKTILDTHVQVFGADPKDPKTKEVDIYNKQIKTFLEETLPHLAKEGKHL